MSAPQTQKEALVLALTLAITAPDEHKTQLALEQAELLAQGLSDDELEACKSLAQIQAGCA